MENENKQGSGQASDQQDNKAVERSAANNVNRTQEVSESNQDVRSTSGEQINQANSGEGINSEAAPLTGLAKGYNLANALEEYDEKEMRPQIAEFWRFRSRTHDQQGYI